MPIKLREVRHLFADHELSAVELERVKTKLHEQHRIKVLATETLQHWNDEGPSRRTMLIVTTTVPWEVVL